MSGRLSGNRDDWANTKRATLGILASVGALSIVAAVIEEGGELADLGMGGWLASPISNGNFAAVVGLVLGVVATTIFAVNEVLKRRELDARRREISAAYAEDDEADGRT